MGDGLTVPDQLTVPDRLTAPVRLLTADDDPTLARWLAELTRLAYAGSDPVPGLPDPDGAFDTAEAVRAQLTAGLAVYAILSDSRPIAALRVRQHPEAWVVSRIAVLPSHRGAGLVRRLLAAAGQDAHAHGVPELSLDAVVERCLPPLYARLGFEVRSNWPSPDKPLSEVTMTRPAAGRVPVRLGWRAARLTDHTAVVAWFLVGGRLFRVGVPASGSPLADTATAAALLAEPDPLLAGLDLSRQPSDSRGGVRPAGTGRADPEHLMPRTRHPDTLALWRPTPGRETPGRESPIPPETLIWQGETE